MKIFSPYEIKAWDESTMLKQRISSQQLMERAARNCVIWLEENYPQQQHYTVFCGMGNNGGDGLAIARLLKLIQKKVVVYIYPYRKDFSKDALINYSLIKDNSELPVYWLEEIHTEFNIPENTISIDCLMGTGLNRPLDSKFAALINAINELNQTIIAIDTPTGLNLEGKNWESLIIKASHTLSFQSYKKSFFVEKNYQFTGQIHLLDIELDLEYYQNTGTNTYVIDHHQVKKMYRAKPQDAHKGEIGKCLLIGGQKTMSGAIILSGLAALKSGIGVLYCALPESCIIPYYQHILEAVLIESGQEVVEYLPDLQQFDAVGLGPGLGRNEHSYTILHQLLSTYLLPLVIDADALNIIALHPNLLHLIPEQSIITPHIVEFERLFGVSENGWDRLTNAKSNAIKYNIIIILKGKYTSIHLPDGQTYFNIVGNVGLAKAGSGDVLTGIITSLLGQGYSPAEAAIIGVYLHASTSILANKTIPVESITSRDLTFQIPSAIRSCLYKN